MVRAILKVWKLHLTNHIFLYLFSFLAFLIGSSLGAYTVKTLGIYELRELVEYLDNFLQGMTAWQINSIVVTQDAVINNLKFVLLIWFLGLTVIGIPIILGIIVIKGFILGFTVGFLFIEKSYFGLLISIFGILPQNLFYVLGLIIGGVSALIFSLNLIKGTLGKKSFSVSQAFISYILLLFFLIGLIIIGGLIEGFVAPLAMKIIISYF